MNKQIYRILMVCTFAVAFVATGCKKQTPIVDKGNGFKLSKNAVQIEVNKTAKVDIVGDGTYSAASGNADIADAKVEGKTVVISAKDKVGETVIKVFDAKSNSQKVQEIKVTVTPKSTNPNDIPDGAVIENGVLVSWDCDKIPADGHITIPAPVTEIAEKVFYRCYSLKSVTFNDNLKSIGASAFSGCTSLESVVFAKGLTSIGEKAFYNCNVLKEVKLLDNVEKIEESAFEFCDALQKISLSPALKEIGDRAFAGCPITSIVIPAKVGKIGYGIFSTCEKITAIEVEGANPDFVSSDGVLFSKDKTRLLQYPAAKSATSFAIPNSVKKIDKEAFYGCNRLTSITIPNSITRIEDATFYDTGITSIEIPNSVTYIGEHAFSQTKLTSVKLPESVASLGDNVFANNDDLTRIEFNGKITKIPINAFYQCEALTNIVWGTNSNVTEIEDGAFYSCSELTSLDLPSKLTTIGKLAFSDCTAVTSIHLPAKVAAIGEKAFAVMYAVTNIKCDAVQPPKLGKSVFERIGEDHEGKKVKLTVPKNSKTAYSKADQWKDFDIAEKQ